MCASQIVPGTGISIGTHGAQQEAPLAADLRKGVTVAGVTGTLEAPSYAAPPDTPLVPEIAIRRLLQEASSVTDLTSTRIYEIRLPINIYKEVRTITKTIVIRHSGGTALQASPLIEPDLLVYCYGEDAYEANRVYQAVFFTLNGLTNRDIYPSPNTLLNSFFSVLGQPLIDPDTRWDYVLSTLSCMMTNT